MKLLCFLVLVCFSHCSDIKTDVLLPERGRTKVVPVHAGERVRLNDGQYKVCAITGKHFIDMNGDGYITPANSETYPLENAQVHFCPNGDETLCVSTFTDSKGGYQVVLEPGEHYVWRFFCPPEQNFFLSNNIPNAHCGGANALQLRGENGQLIGVETASFHLTSCDRKLIPPRKCGCYSFARISGTLFVDTDKNGLQSDSTLEPGIPRIEVKLTRGDDTNFVRWTTTDSAGRYVIDDLYPGGPFNIHFILSDGKKLKAFEFSKQHPESDGVSLEIKKEEGKKAQGRVRVKGILFSGEEKVVNQGLYQFSNIKGTVWNDENRNGNYDIGEVPLSNVRVALYSTAVGATPSEIIQKFVASQFSDTDGNYHFPHLEPGQYFVKFDTANENFVHTLI